MKKGARPFFFGRGRMRGQGRAGQGRARQGRAGLGRAGRGGEGGRVRGEEEDFFVLWGFFWVSHSRYIYITCLMFLFLLSKTAVPEYFTYYLHIRYPVTYLYLHSQTYSGERKILLKRVLIETASHDFRNKFFFFFFF